MIDKLISKRKPILFIELAGLLHDIGKLSKAFLEYRQKWQDYKDQLDPHVDNFFDKNEYESFTNQVPGDFKTELLRKLNFNEFEETDFTIKKAVDNHDKKDSTGITRMLKAADGLDSAIDRNNPLWSAEQKDLSIID